MLFEKYVTQDLCRMDAIRIKLEDRRREKAA